MVLLVCLAGCVTTWDSTRADDDPYGDWDGPGTERRAEEPPFEEAEEPAPSGPTGNVVITVERHVLSRKARTSFDAFWRFADDDIVIRGGGHARRNGIFVGASTGNFEAALSAAIRSSRTSRRERMRLVTLSGRRARLSVGRLTHLDVLRYRTPAGRLVVMERAFVGASLAVKPTVLPGRRLRVVLYPVFSRREGREVAVSELQTEVIVRHGQKMVIGALDESSDSVGAALFHRGARRERTKTVMILTPVIQGVPVGGRE